VRAVADTELFRDVARLNGRMVGVQYAAIPSLHGAMLKQALLGYAARHRASVDGQAPEPGRPSAPPTSWPSRSRRRCRAAMSDR